MFRKVFIVLSVLIVIQTGCSSNNGNGPNDYDVVNVEETNEEKNVPQKTRMLARADSYEDAQEIAREYGLKIVTTYNAISTVRNRWYGVFEKTSSKKKNLRSLMKDIKSAKGEFIAEPDYSATAFAVPDDPRYDKLWGLNDPIRNADINAEQAWDINTGSHEVVVGVIDTGLNYKHPDLIDNLWINPDEIPGNGIDDDNNGYIDDIHGINGITDSGDPDDDHSHGTHIAGTIGGVGNNGIGVTGVCWEVKIMGLKFLNKKGTGETSNAVKCIDYAIDQKLKGHNIVALNNSWGDLPYGQIFEDAIMACNDVGIIFVTAAGNGSTDSVGDDNDATPVYPASFDFPHVVAVAATSDLNKLTKFSNFGATSVDLGAPGIGIYSTKLNDTYGKKNGTSMAAPHVAGAFALLAAEYPNDSIETRIRRVLDNVDKLPALSGKVLTGGKLNLYNAMTSGLSNRPKANYSYKTTTNDLIVEFTDTSTSTSSTIASWEWAFGDGNTSSSQHPTHRYDAKGSYKVTLAVIDKINKTDSISRQVVVSGGDSNLYARLPYNTSFESGNLDQYWETEVENLNGRVLVTDKNYPNSGNAHLTMDVKNTGNYCTNRAMLHVDLSGESQVAMSFYWKDFGDEDDNEDGVFFSDDGGANYEKVYSLTGDVKGYQKIDIDVDQLATSMGMALSDTFVIKFQQRDNYSITSDGFAIDDVMLKAGTEPINQPPIVDANGPYTGSTGNAINFRSSGSDDSDGWIDSYLWDFGDNTTSSDPNPSHTYSHEGTYEVSLTVTDNKGATNTTATTVTINDTEIALNVGIEEVYYNTSTSSSRRAMPFTMPEDGVINSVTMYHNGGQGKMTLAVYDGAGKPLNRLGVTEEEDVNTNDGWQTINLLNSIFVQKGTKIWLAWVYENNPGIKFKSGSPGRCDAEITWSGGMPDSFGGCSQSSYMYSLYATYTPKQ